MSNLAEKLETPSAFEILSESLSRHGIKLIPSERGLRIAQCYRPREERVREVFLEGLERKPSIGCSAPTHERVYWNNAPSVFPVPVCLDCKPQHREKCIKCTAPRWRCCC